MKKQARDKELVIMAGAKAIICALLAGVVVYSIVAGIPVDAGLLKVILALLAGYFGLSAGTYYRGSAGRGGGRGGG